MLELPLCNTDTFQVYLNELSVHRPDEYKIVVLDNGRFHKAERLNIPDNIALLFLPPYSPELNPAEKMWARYKRQFTNLLFNSLDEVSLFIENTTNSLSDEIVKSTCSYKYISQYINWTT